MIHNLLWDGESVLLRGAITVSSLFTGLAVGAISGAVAWLISRRRRRAV
ncbi:hypothetical protein [Paractinoplanes atraurantiacus]|nr:hypothetical protein [Actinoplanes atraurantiacus]